MSDALRKLMPDVDQWGVPLELPEDLDTSTWPAELRLWESYARTSRSLWHIDREEYSNYIQCLDQLIKHCNPGFAPHQKKYLRKIYHRLFCTHYRVEIPPYNPKAKDDKDDDRLEGDSRTSPNYLKTLTESARKIKQQPDSRQSAQWAAEHLTMVQNCGWDAIKPKDVIGLVALGMLQEGLQNPSTFYEKLLLNYSVKQKDKSATGVSDDGREQIEYAERLAKRAKEGGT